MKKRGSISKDSIIMKNHINYEDDEYKNTNAETEINKIITNNKGIIDNIIKNITTFVSTNINNPITQLIKNELKLNDTSWKKLTQKYLDLSTIEKNWENIHNFRKGIYECISSLLLTENGYDFSPMGSKEMNSDIDITIFKKHNETCIFFIYGFSYYIHMLTGDVTMTFNSYQFSYLYKLYSDKFRPMFDVVPYTTNGIIIADNKIEIKKVETKMLKLIAETPNGNKYQVLHNPMCQKQTEMYYISLVFILFELEGYCDDKHLIRNIINKLVNKLRNINEVKEFEELLDIMSDIISGDNLKMFYHQIKSTKLSNEYQEKILNIDIKTNKEIKTTSNVDEKIKEELLNSRKKEYNNISNWY